MMEQNGAQGSPGDGSEMEVQVEERLAPFQEGKRGVGCRTRAAWGKEGGGSQAGSGDGGRGEGEAWGSSWGREMGMRQ